MVEFTLKKDGCLKNIGIGFLILVAIGVISSMLNSKSSNNNNQAEIANVVTTQEEEIVEEKTEAVTVEKLMLNLLLW